MASVLIDAYIRLRQFCDRAMRRDGHPEITLTFPNEQARERFMQHVRADVDPFTLYGRDRWAEDGYTLLGLRTQLAVRPIFPNPTKEDDMTTCKDCGQEKVAPANPAVQALQKSLDGKKSDLARTEQSVEYHNCQSKLHSARVDELKAEISILEKALKAAAKITK